MKKLYLIFLSILISVLTLSFVDLKSFAYDENFNFPTAGVTITINEHWARGDGYYRIYTKQCESIYPIVFVNDGGDAYAVSPMAYGHCRSAGDITNDSSYVPDLTDVNWVSIGWSNKTLNINGENVTFKYSNNFSFKVSGASYSNVILFDNYENAFKYLLDPENPDNVENIENEDGKEIVNSSLSPTINWGDNNPNDIDNPWRPDTENIPAPQFEVVYDENGNVTNQIRFSNYIYNYSAGHGEDRIYGLRMTVMWNTYGSFLFDHTGGLLSQEYKVTYSDLLVGDIDTVFAFPEKENQIVRCPQTFNFNTNQAVIDSFNDLLTTYDVDERTYNTNFSVSNDLTLTNKFKSFLERITCPYNSITFSVQYYRRMSDGTFHYGPWSTGKFTAPQQGAVFNANGVTLSGVGGMVQGNGGGLSGTDESGKWNNNWGNNTSDNLFNMSNLELDKVKANMTGLFSFFGEMPSFIQQCFLFLPDWVIAFIIACIVLVCAIGALKLALG